MRKVVGCMTGTSMDGLDLCLVEIKGKGMDLSSKITKQASYSLKNFFEPFSKLSQSLEIKLPDFLHLAAEFGHYHGMRINEMLAGEKADLICAHGQTLYHKPPLSLQLLNPFTLASITKTPLVYDLRGMDLACGGEGAPITPIADQILYQIRDITAILNFGGFCNYTLIDPNKTQGRVQGGDICACNLLLNQLSKYFFNQEYDKDGLIALSGKVEDTLFKFLIEIFNQQAQRHKSLGTNDDLFYETIQFSEHISPENILRTVCCVIAEVIARQIEDAVTIILAGGGSKNKCLALELTNRLKGVVKTSEECGVPSEMREAACFAILGALCQDRVSIIIPEITGGQHSFISGAWVYP